MASDQSKKTLQSNTLPAPTFPCKEKCDACINVAALNDRISELKREIAQLEAERAKHFSRVNNHHDIITKRLPFELFTKILQLSLPRTEHFKLYALGYNSPRMQILGPLVFSAVSRRWRDIVCSAPILWSSVPIYRPRSFPRAMEELTETWISRSSQCPLSIAITIGTVEPFSEFIPRLLNQCSHRLENLEMEGVGLSMVTHLESDNSSLRSDAIIALKRRPLYTGSYPSSATLRLQPGLQLETPELESLLLHDIIAGVHTSRLTHVNLAWQPVATCMDLLVWAPMVVAFSVHGVIEREHTLSGSPITHRGLRNLRITCDTAIISSMLRYLTIPSLQHLECISWNSQHSPSLLDAIRHCLQRSSATLKYLSLQELLLDSSVKGCSSMKALIGAVSPSIRRLNLGVKLTGPDPDVQACLQKLIDSVFKEQKPLPYLQSITFDADYERVWLPCLKALLVSISQFVSADGVRPISLVMRFQSSPLKLGDNLVYTHQDGTVLLPRAEIAEILSWKERFDVTIKLLVEGISRDEDISDKMLGILTRMSQGE